MQEKKYLTRCMQPQAMVQSTLSVPHMPVHLGGSRLVVVVAQEVDRLAVLPGNGTHIFPALVFISVSFGQPVAKFIRVVLAAWHDGAHCQNSHVVFLQLEESERIVKTIHDPRCGSCW